MALLSQAERHRFMNKPDSHEQDSDRVVSTTGEPGNAAPCTPARPPTEMFLQYPPQEWAVLQVKNLNLFPANFGFDKNEWLSDEIGPRQVFTAMAAAFRWDENILKWFLESENILWMFSKGGKPTGEGKYFHQNITRKTKIIGMLPFILFPDFVYYGAHGQRNLDFYGKQLWTPEEARSTSYSEHAPNDFDWSRKKILLEVLFRGSAHDSLLFFNANNSFMSMFADVNSVALRQSRIEQWAA